MKREDKNQIIENLTEEIKSSEHFYLADISDLNASDSSDLRRLCFNKGVKIILAKNTLLRKALENSGEQFDELHKVLKGNTSILLAEQANVPAKVIKEFRKKSKKPIIKAAFVEESFYYGDQVEVLANLKSKNDLIADVILLLQSPAKNVISSLQSGGNILTGVLETLSNKE